MGFRFLDPEDGNTGVSLSRPMPGLSIDKYDWMHLENDARKGGGGGGGPQILPISVRFLILVVLRRVFRFCARESLAPMAGIFGVGSNLLAIVAALTTVSITAPGSMRWKIAKSVSLTKR